MKSIILAISISILIIITSGDTEVNKEVVEQFRQAEVNWFTKSTDKDLQKSKQGDASTSNLSVLGSRKLTIATCSGLELKKVFRSQVILSSALPKAKILASISSYIKRRLPMRRELLLS